MKHRGTTSGVVSNSTFTTSKCDLIEDLRDYMYLEFYGERGERVVVVLPSNWMHHPSHELIVGVIRLGHTPA